MTTLNDEIKQAIEKDLPNQVGVQLKQQLDLLEKVKQENKLLTEKVEKLEDRNNSLALVITDCDAVIVQHQQLDERFEAINNRERDIELTLLKHELAVAKEFQGKSDQHLRLFLQNPVEVNKSWKIARDHMTHTHFDASGQSYAADGGYSNHLCTL